MSVADGKRLDPAVFRLDPRMRRGRYTDRYFLNVRDILSALAREGYRFRGESRILAEQGISPPPLPVGEVEVEMQCFARREPFTVACGVDHALAILKRCTGYFDRRGRFRNTSSRLEVEAVLDGERLEPWVPALKIRGRYRDFAILETPILGVLARQSRIATNTYRLLCAARGKPVFFSPRATTCPRHRARTATPTRWAWNGSTWTRACRCPPW